MNVVIMSKEFFLVGQEHEYKEHFYYIFRRIPSAITSTRSGHRLGKKMELENIIFTILHNIGINIGT